MRLIDADEMLKDGYTQVTKEEINKNGEWMWVVRPIATFPTIEVEPIVRCKDCINCEITVPISHPDTTLYECQLWKYDRDGGYLVKPNGYCYKGERK